MEDLGLNITQLVELYLPAGFSVSGDYLKSLIRVYQLTLQEAAGIPEEDKYDITKWPEKWQLVIGYLIVYAIYRKLMAQAFVNAIGGGESISETTGGEDLVKKITTGPTEVEYHNSADSLAKIMKALQDGSFLSGLISDACPIASSLGIKLPFCPAYKEGSYLLVKPGKICRSLDTYINITNTCGEEDKPASMA